MVIEDTARIAVYDDLLSAPRIVDIAPQSIPDFIEAITVTTYELSRQQGGHLPYTVIKEITENFIHAGFLACTVSILDEGNTLRFSDQGPGIAKKELVLHPGVSSARHWMKDYIRGVGSGFPTVKEYLLASCGYLTIEDNAEDGVVVTISLSSAAPEASSPDSGASTNQVISRDILSYSQQTHGIGTIPTHDSPAPRALKSLSKREEKTLLILNEHGMLGPVDLAELLDVSAATAYRLLQKLEELGMVESTQHKKRFLSNAGMACIQELLV